MRSTAAALLLSCALAPLAACGTKSKTGQAEAFYDEKLHTTDQKACNARGFLYDALEAKCRDDIKLATWTCTRAGLAARLTARDTAKTATDADAAGLTALDAKITAGYTLHQCGEDTSGAIFTVIIKKGTDGDNATLAIEHGLFTTPPPAPVAAPDSPGGPAPSTAPSAVKNNGVVAPADAAIIGDGGTWSAIGACTPFYAMVIATADNERGVLAADITVGFEFTAVTGIVASLYSDAACTAKIAGESSAEQPTVKGDVTLPKGSDSAGIFVKAALAAGADATARQTGYMVVKSLSVPVFANRATATFTFAADADKKAFATVSPEERPYVIGDGNCMRIALVGRANEGLVVAAADVPMELTFNEGSKAALYADAACATALTAPAIPAGPAAVSVFLKRPAAEATKLTMKIPSLGINQLIELD